MQRVRCAVCGVLCDHQLLDARRDAHAHPGLKSQVSSLSGLALRWVAAVGDRARLDYLLVVSDLGRDIFHLLPESSYV